MSLITYSEFCLRVRRNVFPDIGADHLEPINLNFSHTTYIQNALIQAQTYIECLRQNNVNTYTLDDAIVNCGVATFSAPEHIRVGAVYAYKPAKGCSRIHYNQKSVQKIMCFVDEYSGCKCKDEGDICNSVRTGGELEDGLLRCDESKLVDGFEVDTSWDCQDKIFAVGMDSSIYVAPRILVGYRLAIHWEGIKYRYADTDLITDDPDLLDLVSTYVQAERARTFDRDLPLYQELLGKGPTVRGMGGSVWHMKISAMAHRCREERRIRTKTCSEMWDDSALSSENIGAQLNPVPSRDEADVEFTDPCPPQECTENQYAYNGECVDCVTPTVAISANINSILVGGSVTLSWSNTVPPLISSVVTLEYGDTVVTLGNNTSGTIVLTPTTSNTYLIRASTVCGTVVATVGVAVNHPCVCPDGLPECLQLDVVTPSEIFLNCALSFDSGGDILWDGQMPLISPCKWGYEFPNELYAPSGLIPTNAAISPIIELVSCDPFRYKLTFTILQDGTEFVAWEGYCNNFPVGTYVSANKITEVGCADQTDFDVIGCFDTTCDAPVIRFDPPSGATVSLPTIVFIHSTNDDDLIFYSLDNGESYHSYTGPLSIGEGQTLLARSFTLAGCPSTIYDANYTALVEGSLEFDFLCATSDHAGVFYAFYADGQDNDYHWRINITRPLPWALNKATIYETNSSGIWVTGQAWATQNPIYPIEMNGNPFSVYPMVLMDGVTQVNTTYHEPVVLSIPAGNQVYHAYGQPFIPLTGYFRLELVIDEGSGPVTLYKLIPHVCEPPDCVAPSAPTVDVDCDLVATIHATVEPKSTYRIRSTACNSGVFQDLTSGISLTGEIDWTEDVAAGCVYSYIVSTLCVATGEWTDSVATTVTTPTAAECACGAADCAGLENTYYLRYMSEIQTAVLSCIGYGDDEAPLTTPDNYSMWDQSYSRPVSGCGWLAPDNVLYEMEERRMVFSTLSRVIVGESCYWQVIFYYGDNEAVYRKTTGHTPSGTYDQISDNCATFPAQIEISETLPD